MKRSLSVVTIAALGANAWARDDVYIPLPFLNADESQVQIYSFEVQASTARYGVNWQHNDWYGSGNAIALGGSIPGSDLYFGVSAAVPEADVHQLFLLGLTFGIGLPFGRARLARRFSS